MMLEPAPGGGWWLFVRAIAAVVLVGMAGAFPCCCERPDSSTSTQPPGSTSTSTGTPPPLPPRPPGSTSSGPVPLPPIRSSSVGPIAYLDCPCCQNPSSLADQWQAEIFGVTAGTGIGGTIFCGDCTTINGVYICDSLANTGADFAAGGTYCPPPWRGCSCGESDGVHNPDLECDGGQVYQFLQWLLTPAGVYYSSAIPFFTVGPAISGFQLVYGDVPDNLCSLHYRWVKRWNEVVVDPAFPALCSQMANEDRVPCESVNGAILDFDTGSYTDEVCSVNASTCIISAIEGP